MSRKLKLKTKPFPHQVKAMRRALAQGSHAFFFEPRCGKTKAALDTIAVRAYRGEVRRVVVFAPLIALDVWVSQIQEHFSLHAGVTMVDEGLVLLNRRYPPAVAFYLINYDKFSRRGEDYVYRNRYVQEVERWDPDVLVLDESHRCKKAGAVRSQAIWRMVRRLREHRHDLGRAETSVYLLTGTPNPKGYIDLFSQYRILDDSIFGTNKADFEDRHVEYGKGRRKYTIVRYRQERSLLRKVHSRATTVTAEEAGLAGKEFFNPIRVTLPPKARELYERFAEDLVAEIQGEFVEAKNPGVRRMRLLQITGGFTTSGKEIHRAKLAAASDYLDDLRQQGESVVVYARFLPEVRALGALVRSLGFHTNAISGETPRKLRTESIRVFQHGRQPACLVFQAEAGALAVELTRAAETFWYSLPDSLETFLQGTARVKGPNQTKPVRHNFLIARGTIDPSILRSLREKKDMHDTLMQNPRGFVFGMI